MMFIHTLKGIFSQLIEHWKGLKAAIDLHVILEDVDGSNVKKRKLFSPWQRYIHPSHTLDRLVVCLEYLNATLSTFTEEKSDYRLHSIEAMDIRIGQYQAIRGNGYLPSPSNIRTKHII